ncbi:MAG: LacI family DNA-binding transcriptional regulator [Lachnospiraceae bacterium]|nr:LacI family DNA-binding transcriptional regulator [Lachnospiraceae bacterium]
MTIYDISEKAGVSIATVSRVLNGNTNVKPKTKKRVMDVIEEYGYTPNAFARGLGLNTMNTIGILCADSSDLYLAKAVYFIEQFLRENDYNSILCCTGYDIESKKASLDLLLSKRVDSVIMVGSNFISNQPEENKYIHDAAQQVPIMLLNADFDYPNVYCTLCDDYKAMFEATQILINSGLDKVLYLYNSQSYSGLKKLSGYQAAMLQDNLEFKREYMQFYQGERENIEAIADFLTELADSGLSFNSVVASDDILAMGAMKYSRRKKLRIPEEFAIIGYNNSLLTSCCEPPLTSVDNRLQTLCNQLVKTLMGVLSGNEMPQKVIFSGELIKRGTTNF